MDTKTVCHQPEGLCCGGLLTGGAQTFVSLLLFLFLHFIQNLTRLPIK